MLRVRHIELKKHLALGVLEIWFWQDNRLVFDRLAAGKYGEITASVSLPDLTSQELAKFANREFNESPLTVEADFLKYLN